MMTSFAAEATSSPYCRHLPEGVDLLARLAEVLDPLRSSFACPADRERADLDDQRLHVLIRLRLGHSVQEALKVITDRRPLETDRSGGLGDITLEGDLRDDGRLGRLGLRLVVSPEGYWQCEAARKAQPGRVEQRFKGKLLGEGRAEKWDW